MPLKLKIRQPDLSPHSCQVWLDDHEITIGLRSLSIDFHAEEVTTARLEIYVDDLDVDAQTLAALQAHVKQPDRPEPNVLVLGIDARAAGRYCRSRGWTPRKHVISSANACRGRMVDQLLVLPGAERRRDYEQILTAITPATLGVRHLTEEEVAS